MASEPRRCRRATHAGPALRTRRLKSTRRPRARRTSSSRGRVAALAPTDAVAGTFPCTSSIASLSVRVAPGVSAEAASSMVGDALRSCAVVDFGAEAEVFATSATDGYCGAPSLDFAARFRAACAAEAPDDIIVAPTVAARSVPAAAAAYRALGAATFALSLRSANDAASLQASARVLPSGSGEAAARGREAAE